MNEDSTIELLNTLGTNLVKCKDEFSSYDAEDGNYIVEIKNRRKFYSTKLIECLKLFKNYQKSQLNKKDFLYVVTDDKGCYIYNISKNISEIVSLNVKAVLCPVSTDFNRNDKIIKYSFELPVNISKTINYV